MKPIITLLLLLGSFYSFAQGAIKGTVYDETGEVMPFASIYLEDKAIGCVSDVDGNYSIDNLPAGEYTLKASYIGYETLTIEGLVVKSDKITFQNFEFKEYVTLTCCCFIIVKEDTLPEKTWDEYWLTADVFQPEAPDTLKEAISIFPNPMQVSATVVFDNPFEDMFSYSIFDMSGRLVRRSDGNQGAQFMINREGLERGAYIIDVQAGLNRQTSRFVVQ